MSISDDKIDKVRTVIRKDHRLTVREIGEELGIIVDSCHEILPENLNMHSISEKFLPRLLSDDQKENSINISQERCV